MKVTILLAVCVGLAVSQVPIPDGALLAVRNAGIATIGTQVKAVNKALTDAVAEFKPINTTCNAKIDANIKTCGDCVQQKCKARAESVCKPEEWQVILGKTIGFFKDGIPNFFTSTIPDVFVDKIGGGIVDVTKDIGSFFEDKIGGGVIDAGKAIGGVAVDGVNGVIDFGKGIGKGVVDFGKKIGAGVVDIGNKIKDGFGKAIDGIKGVGEKIGNFGKDIGNAFGDLFGKREELSYDEFIRTRRAGEPSCGDFENDPEAACQHYLTPTYCSTCKFDPKTECVGYQAAVDKINSANAARKWLTKVSDQKYNILKMSFNPALMDPASGGFKNVQASVYIFGKTFDFTVSQAINPYIPNVAGPVIANQALELFKKA